MASRGVELSHNAAGLRFWSSGVHEIGESARRNEAERHDSRRTFISQLNTHTHHFSSQQSHQKHVVPQLLNPPERSVSSCYPLSPWIRRIFSPVGRFAPSRQWQRPPQPRSRWETGCCRPSIATAMWVTRSLSCRPELTFPRHDTVRALSEAAKRRTERLNVWQSRCGAPISCPLTLTDGRHIYPARCANRTEQSDRHQIALISNISMQWEI